MQKVVVFGDSYAVSGADKNQTTWVDMLCNEYDVSIHAKEGCGPDYCLKKFLEQHHDLHDSIVIFVVPHHLRIMLHNNQPWEDVYSFVYLHDKLKGVSQRIKTRLNILKGKELENTPYGKYVKKYGKFLDQWYNFFLKGSTYLDTEPVKICATLTLYQDYTKQTILFPVHNLKDNEYNLLRKKIKISNLSLKDLDESENVDIDTIIKNKGIDYRAGHLSYDNHVKFYNHVKELIDGKI